MTSILENMTKTLHRADIAPKQRLSDYVYLLDQKHINFPTFHYKKMKSLKRSSLLTLAFVQYHEMYADCGFVVVFHGVRITVHFFDSRPVSHASTSVSRYALTPRDRG